MRDTIRTLIPLLLLSWTTAGFAVQAGEVEVVNGPSMLPPPPGPYISSRQDLTQTRPLQGNRNRMPFMGDMPNPNLPLRYMPAPRQFPAPGNWWNGPVGRW